MATAPSDTALATTGGMMPAARDILLEQFGQACYQFLDASCEVWPECSVLKLYKAEFDAANANPVIAKTFVESLHGKFQEQFKAYITQLIQKDASVVTQPVPFLLEVKAASKYASADSSVQDTCLEYAKQIAQAASINDVYSKCPSRMMDQVAKLATSFVKDIEAGRMDISTLNPLEISQKVMSSLNPSDIEEFGKQLSAQGGMEGVMSMMQNVMGSMPGGMGGLGNMMSSLGAGGFDPSALAGMMSSLGGSGGGADGGLASMMGGLDLASMMKMMNGGANAGKRDGKKRK